jgi:hypothetical protein
MEKLLLSPEEAAEALGVELRPPMWCASSALMCVAS